MIYTHQYITSNTDNLTLQREWILITKFVLDTAKLIRLKYWPGDIIRSMEDKNYLSTTFGINSIKKHQIKTIKIDDNMEELICPVNSETRQIILHVDRVDSISIHNLITAWFHIELLNDKYDIILYSGDFGSDILINLSKEEESKLKGLLLKPDNLISLIKI